MTRQDTSDPVANDPVAETTQQAAVAAMKGCTLLMETTGRMQVEWLRFMRERLDQNMELADRLMSARTPAELVERQISFINTMTADYAEQSRRMLELASGGVQGMAALARTEDEAA